MEVETAGRARRGVLRRPLLSVVALAAVLGVVGVTSVVAHRTEAAFTGTTANASTWATGTVSLSGTPSGAALNLTGLVPGATGSRCITVQYTGTVAPVQVRLYTASSSDPGGLGSHVTLNIQQVPSPGTTPCESMSGTVIFSGTVSTLSSLTGYEVGRGPWSVASAPASMTYRIGYTVDGTPPRNATLTLNLVWEART